VDNRRTAEVFGDIARLLELRGDNAFTVRAYRLAAITIEELPSDLGRMLEEGRDLAELPGIGKAIAKKIGEMVDTGDLQYYQRLRAEFPEEIVELMRVPGMGPKTAGRLWKEHGITSVSALHQALEDGALSTLPGLGRNTIANVRRALSSTGERA
jgi:DNA polymerase (family 10)